MIKNSNPCTGCKFRCSCYIDYLEEFYEKYDITTRQYEALQKKYIEVLKLAKENADSYEYCLQELEEKIAELQQYKASKQASYEAMQKRCNALELENRELRKEKKNENLLF
ncbi:MAG: hypothetical protein NC191_06990 [Muribaculaceae bacterium]|nr:hypothetical protein [Muribaculaceae bacterium]